MNNLSLIFFGELSDTEENVVNGIHPYDPGAVRHISPERLAELSNDIYLNPVPARARQAC